MRLYAGIGSRKTPVTVLREMQYIGAFLAQSGWTLRSGAADGADRAFEWGCDAGNGTKEIFLPWSGFQGRYAGESYGGRERIRAEITLAAFAIAETIHPAWHKLTTAVKKLHARNVFQILGFDLETPVERVICWTPNGGAEGGTRTAIVLAKRNGITVQNLFTGETK